MQAIAYPVRRRTPRGGFVAEGRVRSLPVVILDPGSDLDPCMGQAEEQGFVEQLVAHVTVESEAGRRPTYRRSRSASALRQAQESLARRDVMPFHPDLPVPCQHRIAGKLGASLRKAQDRIAVDDHLRLAALGDQIRLALAPPCDWRSTYPAPLQGTPAERHRPR